MPPFDSMKYNDEWSEIFTDLRKEAGLTQRQAASQAGLSPNYVGAIESRKVSPTVRNLDKVLNMTKSERTKDLIRAAEICGKIVATHQMAKAVTAKVKGDDDVN